MDMRPGYKQSDAGVIPEDWEAISLGSLVEPNAPIRYGVVQIGADTPNGVPIVPIKYVKEIDSARLHKSSPKIEARFSGSRITGGDLLISVKGTIGRVGIVPSGFNGNIAREIARVRMKSAECPEFVMHQLEAEHTQRRINEAVVGTTRLEFSIAAVRKFKIPMPPTHAEQKRVADALSDADRLISVLSELIAKKRDLRTGTMQRLLTGETRLPNFNTPWATKTLGSILAYEQPTKYLVSSSIYNESFDVPVITAGKSFILGYTDEKDNLYANLPVIMFDDFTTASRLVNFPFKIKSSAVKLLKLRDPSMVLSVVHGIMAMVKIPIVDHKRRWISEYQHQEVLLPSPEEQNAIAKVLDDMQAEIVSLERRLKKLHALKQGMMQALLTGRVRLPVQGKALDALEVAHA